MVKKIVKKDKASPLATMARKKLIAYKDIANLTMHKEGHDILRKVRENFGGFQIKTPGWFTCSRSLTMLSCLGAKTADDKRQKKTDVAITKRMKACKKEFDHTYRLLLLGSGESGKSTIVKQMQILHKEGFTNEDRRKKKPDIYRNLLDSIVAICKALKTLQPPIKLQKECNEKILLQILNDSENLHFDYPPEFFENVKILWADAGIQAAYQRACEYQLIDCAKYFLDRVDKLKQSTYLPDDQDLLRCRTQTTGIHQVRFSVDKVNFHMFDVGGQRYERRRWCQCFHGITAILFVTAMSDYNLLLAEDNTQNRLSESIKLFDEVWRNRFLQGVSVILFLNKQDLLREKILANSKSIEEFYPEFAKYKKKASSKDVFEPSDTHDVIKAKLFIRDLFLNVKLASQNSNSVRQCYPHYTCAVDTDNIKRIFNDVKNTIQIINLKNYELI